MSFLRRVTKSETDRKNLFGILVGLAKKLHSDAVDDRSAEISTGKLKFDFYGGASPSRYDEFFRFAGPRKKNGRYVDRDRERDSQLPLGAQETQFLRLRLKSIASGAEMVLQKPDIANVTMPKKRIPGEG